MIRLLTAAAMAALLASPALAQNSSPPSSPGEQPSQLQEQGTTGSGSLGSGSGSTGMESPPAAQSGQVPVDCLPNDARPECQTAQMPSDQSQGSGSLSTSPGATPETQPEPGSPGAAPDTQNQPVPSTPPGGSTDTTR